MEIQETSYPWLYPQGDNLPADQEEVQETPCAQTTSPTIDWSKRHVTKDPQWHNTSKGSHQLAAMLAGVAATFAALCVGSLFLPLPPTITIPVSVICGLIALTTGVASVILLCRKEYWQDPIFLRKKGQEAENVIREGNFPYPKIRQFDSRIWDPIWKNHDLNLLLANDARSLSFSEFFQKHQDDAFAILNSENKKCLQKDFLPWLTAHNLGIEEYQKRYPGVARAFPLNQETKHLLALQQLEKWCRGQLTYSALITNNGQDFLSCLTPRQILSHKESILQAISKEAPSYNQWMNEYRAIQDALQLTEKEMIDLIVRPELNSFFGGRMNYLTLRNRNNPSIFSLLLEEEQHRLRQDSRVGSEFLSQPYATMISEESKQEREFFSIEPQRIWAQVGEDLQSLSYPAFHKKHGILPYQDAIFTLNDLAIGHQKISNYLRGKSYVEIAQYKQDILFLNVPQQEQQAWLQQDFSTLSFPEMVQKHSPALFFDSFFMTPTYNMQWQTQFIQHVANAHSLDSLCNEKLIVAFPKKEPYPLAYHQLFYTHIIQNWEQIFINDRDSTLATFQKYNRVPFEIQQKTNAIRSSFSSINLKYSLQKQQIDVKQHQKLVLLNRHKHEALQNLQQRRQVENCEAQKKGIQQQLTITDPTSNQYHSLLTQKAKIETDLLSLKTALQDAERSTNKQYEQQEQLIIKNYKNKMTTLNANKKEEQLDAIKRYTQ